MTDFTTSPNHRFDIMPTRNVTPPPSPGPEQSGVMHPNERKRKSTPPVEPMSSRAPHTFSDGARPPTRDDEGIPVPDEDPDSHPPRGKFSHKRKEDPTRNPAGKMICTFDPSCKDVVFERKCEWSKHMDKHDRPYKCKHKGCEKLQGFTYSGGLLRHEREVHKLHGGTTKSMFCPYQDCKRSYGTGFTRKENLHEHVRRVHRRASNSDAQPNAANTNEDVSQAVSPADEAVNEYIAPPRTKRRRTASSATVTVDVGDDIHAYLEDPKDSEIRRLHSIIEERDEELRRTQDQMRRQEERIITLETLLSTPRRDINPSLGPV